VTSTRDDRNDPRPVAPLKPQAVECCESGCDPCVYDRYWDAMERYEQALAEWERRQQTRFAQDQRPTKESK